MTSLKKFAKQCYDAFNADSIPTEKAAQESADEYIKKLKEYMWEPDISDSLEYQYAVQRLLGFLKGEEERVKTE